MIQQVYNVQKSTALFTYSYLHLAKKKMEDGLRLS